VITLPILVRRMSGTRVTVV